MQIITLKPLADLNASEAITEELTDKEKTILQAQFAFWRMHLWGKNYGSYNTIERKVNQGKLTPFVCPDPECDCEWKKENIQLSKKSALQPS